MIKKIFLVFLLLFIFSINKILCKTITEDSGIASKDSFEIEVGSDLWKDTISPYFGVKHSVTERMDFGIFLVYKDLLLKDYTFSSIEASTKFSFIPELFSLLFSFESINREINGIFIFSKDFNPFSIDANLGFNQTLNQNLDLIYGLSLHLDLNSFGFYVETTGTQENLSLWQLGSFFLIKKDFKLDLGLNGTYEKNPVLFFTCGFTYSLNY